MFLMFQNIPVLEYQVNQRMMRVLNPAFLPYGLRGRVHTLLRTDYREADDFFAELYRENDAVKSWLASRVLTLSRTHAKQILNACALSQAEDVDTRAEISTMCRAVSAGDCYWVSMGVEEEYRWETVNVRKIPLNEIMINVALRGTSVTVQNKDFVTPELTTQGAYAKSWIRENGTLFLYKTGSVSDYEARVEVAVSDILDSFNVQHVKYELEEYSSVTCCKCRCMADEEYSVVSAHEVWQYCRTNQISFDKLITEDKYRKDFYKMAQVDYLISNTDRHDRNWGFYMDHTNGELSGLHPLFDHNSAFDEKNMKQPDSMYRAKPDKNMQSYAKKVHLEVPLLMIKPLKKNVFIKKEHLDSFRAKMQDLNIPFEEKENYFLPR